MTDFREPTRLMSWVHDHYWFFFGLVMTGMTAIYIGDLLVYPGHPYLPWLPPVEMFGGFIFTVLLRWTKRRIPDRLMRTPLAYQLGHYTLLLALVMIPAAWSFQVMSWMVAGKYQGAAFYFPSLVLAVVLAYRKKSVQGAS